MKTVLVVDDSSFMRSRLKEILIEMGNYLVIEAVNGKDGIDLYKKHKPELVFLDINMPELSGRDALLQIINHDPRAHVVMCSTLGAEDIVAECIEEGAVYYILKPFVKDHVKKLIGDLEATLNG